MSIPPTQDSIRAIHQTRWRMDSTLMVVEKQGSYQVTSAHGSVNNPSAGNRPTDRGKGKSQVSVWVRPAPAKGPLSV